MILLNILRHFSHLFSWRRRNAQVGECLRLVVIFGDKCLARCGSSPREELFVEEQKHILICKEQVENLSLVCGSKLIIAYDDSVVVDIQGLLLATTIIFVCTTQSAVEIARASNRDSFSSRNVLAHLFDAREEELLELIALGVVISLLGL